MQLLKRQLFFLSIILLLTNLLLSSCLTTKKMDKFVADQYNNQLPKQEKKKNTDISVNSSIVANTEDISLSNRKVSNVLPLLLYWQWTSKLTSNLNPSIAVSSFTKALNLQASKDLSKKLNGQKLEVTVEQIPVAFSIVEKGHVVWLIYAISWSKLFVEPDFLDMVVSYKILQNDKESKSGKITIKNIAKNQNIRYFQSWKSATSDHLAQYNQDISAMTKELIKKLIEEL